MKLGDLKRGAVFIQPNTGIAGKLLDKSDSSATVELKRGKKKKHVTTWSLDTPVEYQRKKKHEPKQTENTDHGDHDVGHGEVVEAAREPPFTPHCPTCTCDRAADAGSESVLRPVAGTEGRKTVLQSG